MENKEITFQDIKNFMGDRGIEVKKTNLVFWSYDKEYLYFVPNNKSTFADGSIESDPYILKGILFIDIKNKKNVYTKPCTTTLMYVSRKSMHFELEDELPFYGDKNTDLAAYVKNFKYSDHYQ